MHNIKKYVHKKITKYSLIYIIISTIVSCQQDETMLQQSVKEKQMSETKSFSFTRTPYEAQSAVIEFLSKKISTRSLKYTRSIEKVIDLERNPKTRTNNFLNTFAEKFYVITFKHKQGYAIVSKDNRTFPLYAILDSGEFKETDLYNNETLRSHVVGMIRGNNIEINNFNNTIRESLHQNTTRGHKGNAFENSEEAIDNMLRDGWEIQRQTENRLKTKWGQHVYGDNFYFNTNGVPYAIAYPNKNMKDSPIFTRVAVSEVECFGCTPVAFGQVMYALRNFPGFKDLKYSNGERVLWENMENPEYWKIERKRFLGWFAANCKPTYLKKGTMIFNINATKFLRKIIGENIESRYDNCIVGDGDFDGYGWSEDKKVSRDFFSHPNAFVIMTASAGSLNYISYHTFVIDGMVEFTKRIKGSGFLGTGLFKKWRNGIRHLYHVNAGWNGLSNGYYLYVQNVNDEFKYTGSNDAMDYRSKVAYLILWPKNN